ncbi:MAG: isoprenyl transferase [Candidatus Omnitrophica bacterium]|nr:isoprenyl transferase [Candidatus Omnitrophota bacterium]
MLSKTYPETIPAHVAIIMDGNGRWAQKRGLPRTAGHKKGIDRVKEIVKEAKKSGVKVLTIFAFSTENWLRPKSEISILFSYLDRFLRDYQDELVRENIRLQIIGRRDKFKKKTLESIERVESATRKNKSFTIAVALDYGGRWDILNSLNTICRSVLKGEIRLSDVDEKLFGDHLSLSGLGDPQLLIRTSGEQRISNFLLWNLAYTELYFTDNTWPEFDKKQFQKAIEAYGRRKRRFGGLNE